MFKSRQKNQANCEYNFDKILNKNEDSLLFIFMLINVKKIYYFYQWNRPFIPYKRLIIEHLHLLNDFVTFWVFIYICNVIKPQIEIVKAHKWAKNNRNNVKKASEINIRNLQKSVNNNWKEKYFMKSY